MRVDDMTLGSVGGHINRPPDTFEAPRLGSDESREIRSENARASTFG